MIATRTTLLMLVTFAAVTGVVDAAETQPVARGEPGHHATRGRRFAAGLASGRLVMRELTFAAGSDRLDADARPYIRQLAAAINATSGTYLIEAHVDDTGDPAHDLALSRRRALEVKALLILEGVPPERLVAVGYGAARPLASGDGGTKHNARIEVAAGQ